MNPPLLDVADVDTYYGQSWVLKGISLQVPAAQIIAVLGRNGVGKTTLARTIMGFTPARAGRITLADTAITAAPTWRIVQQGIAIVPQGRRVFTSLTVRENLTIVSAAANVWSIAAVLDFFPRLSERLTTAARSLSGGEQQMLALARALLCNARLIVMDEPTEGLSPTIVEDVKRLIRLLREQGTSVLLLEQNLGFALEVADFVHLMESGRVAYGAVPAVLAADMGAQRTYLGV